MQCRSTSWTRRVAAAKSRSIPITCSVTTPTALSSATLKGRFSSTSRRPAARRATKPQRILTPPNWREPALALTGTEHRFHLVMAVAEPVKRLTEIEYLDLERGLESRNEFFGGEMFAMSCGTPRHSQIATNLAAEFRNRL